MDYSLQRERLRINKILSKLSCNYNSPISLAKQTLNKLTRHKKVYSFEAEHGKPCESYQSVKDLIEKTMENSQERAEVNKSVPHTFTFQTLREILALNPDVVNQVNANNQKNSEIRFKNAKLQKKKRKKVYEYSKTTNSEVHNTVKHLPAMNEFANYMQNSPSFLRSNSKKLKKRLAKVNLGENPKKSKIFDSFITETYEKTMKHESERMIRISPDPIFHEVPHLYAFRKNSNKPKLEKLSPTHAHKAKIINITLPKALKQSYFSETKKKSLLTYKDDEVSLRGWEKITPLDLLEPDKYPF